jgi:hypothetical protein
VFLNQESVMRCKFLLGAIFAVAFSLFATPAQAQCPNGQCGVPQRYYYAPPAPQFQPIVQAQVQQESFGILTADHQFIYGRDGKTYVRGTDNIYRECSCRGLQNGTCPCDNCPCATGITGVKKLP